MCRYECIALIAKVLHLEQSFLWCWNMGTSESRLEIPGKFWNVVLEKDVEAELGRSCEKLGNVTKGQGEEEYPTDNKKKEG